MRSTQQLSITLPNEMADLVRAKETLRTTLSPAFSSSSSPA
jgi:hypothetical protein